MTASFRLRLLLLAFPALVAAGSASAATRRVLSETIPADAIQSVSLEAAVGDIVVRPSADRQIHVRVELQARNSFWGEAKDDRRQVEQATLDADVAGGRLRLSVDAPRRNDRGFSEDWTVEIPATTPFDLESGVGDVSIEGLSGALDLELGVGDLTVTGRDADFGEIDLSCGVGETTLRQPGGRRIRDGVLGNEVESSGSGRSPLRVEVGVGDVDVILR